MKKRTAKIAIYGGMVAILVGLLWHIMSPSHEAPINGPMEIERKRKKEVIEDDAFE